MKKNIQYLRYGFNASLSFPKSEINLLHDCDVKMNTIADTWRNEILDSTTMSLWSTINTTLKNNLIKLTVAFRVNVVR
jgi:hypothetical protein